MNLRDLSTIGVGAAAILAAAPAAADVQYVYDSAGRLWKAIYSNGITIEYRYDAAGNRRNIFPFHQVIDMAHFDARDKF